MSTTTAPGDSSDRTRGNRPGPLSVWVLGVRRGVTPTGPYRPLHARSTHDRTGRSSCPSRGADASTLLGAPTLVSLWGVSVWDEALLSPRSYFGV